MQSESEEARREALLQAAASLKIARDELLTCVELLREFQFNLNSSNRKNVLEAADKLIEKIRGQS